jgi:hypothetical protein
LFDLADISGVEVFVAFFHGKLSVTEGEMQKGCDEGSA